MRGGDHPANRSRAVSRERPEARNRHDRAIPAGWASCPAVRADGHGVGHPHQLSAMHQTLPVPRPPALHHVRRALFAPHRGKPNASAADVMNAFRNGPGPLPAVSQNTASLPGSAPNRPGRGGHVPEQDQPLGSRKSVCGSPRLRSHPGPAARPRSTAAFPADSASSSA